MRLMSPPCPVCGAQPAVDRSIIIILVVALIVVTGLYISDYHIKPWNITCTSPVVTVATGPIVHSNIQAAHTWDMKPYVIPQNNEWGMYCFDIDDLGLLTGNSMQPTFFEGNTVLLRRWNNETGVIHTGDIIRYYRLTPDQNCSIIQDLNVISDLGGSWVKGNTAVIHRINAIYGDDEVVVQGDNLNEMEMIKKCQIVDVVLGILYT